MKPQSVMQPSMVTNAKLHIAISLEKLVKKKTHGVYSTRGKRSESQDGLAFRGANAQPPHSSSWPK